MSTFLEVMGELRLRDTPEVWGVLALLEKELAMGMVGNGVHIVIPEDGSMIARFDYAGECGGISAATIEHGLAQLIDHTVQATYLTIGWDNIREKQFFGSDEDVAALKSRLALEQIGELKKELRADDIAAAIVLLQS